MDTGAIKMIQFIYLFSVIAVLLLVIGFRLESGFIASMACIALILIGVYLLPNGYFSVKNYLTDAIAFMFILLGTLMFININLS